MCGVRTSPWPQIETILMSQLYATGWSSACEIVLRMTSRGGACTVCPSITILRIKWNTLFELENECYHHTIHRCQPLEYCKIIWTRNTRSPHGNSLMTSQFFGMQLKTYLNKLNFCSGAQPFAKWESFHFSSAIFDIVLNFNGTQLCTGENLRRFYLQRRSTAEKIA